MENVLIDITIDDKTVKANGVLSGQILLIDYEGVRITNIELQLVSKSGCSFLTDNIFLKIAQRRHHAKHEQLHAVTYGKRISEDESLYTFHLELPGRIPPSFQGEYGYIKYFLKVIVNNQDNLDISFDDEVTVTPFRDLKLEKHLLNEVKYATNKKLQILLLNLGNVNLNVWMPLSGVAVGQTMPILCTIENDSLIEFQKLCILFSQNEIYRSGREGSKKIMKKTIKEIKQTARITSGTYEYCCMLEIDDRLYPTCMWNPCCRMTYDLKVRLDTSSAPFKEMYTVETKEIPIIIGTEPLIEWDVEHIKKEITKESLSRMDLVEDAEDKISLYMRT